MWDNLGGGIKNYGILTFEKKSCEKVTRGNRRK